MTLRKDGTALCLGCGGGREAFALARKEFKVTAVDQVPGFIEWGKQLNLKLGLNVHFVPGNLMTFKPQGLFDVIRNLERV